MKILNTVPKSVAIKKIIVENEMVKTFILNISVGAKPGQFVNVWIPRLDEKPISVACDDGKELTLTIASVGPFSKAMHELKEGDKVGIRGPFGTTFAWEKNEHLALLGGGYGAAPLYFLAQEASKDNCTIEFIVGARRQDLLLYTERVVKINGVRLHIATDDGSAGHHGYNTQILEKLLNEEKIDKVITVGPEIMMLKAGQMSEAKNVDSQISVERYMKCGFGICGNCCVDGLGVPTCINGPVMPWEQVKQIEDFGKYHRDSLGKKHYY